MGDAAPAHEPAQPRPVGGCLFEVVLDAPAGRRWWWRAAADPGAAAAVTLLATTTHAPDADTGERRSWRFRFRAETAAAFTLEFEERDGAGATTDVRRVSVITVAESMPGEPAEGSLPAPA